MVGVRFDLDGGSGKFFATDSADQGHGNIWIRIGLGKHGSGTSVEDIVLGQGRGLDSHIHVVKAANRPTEITEVTFQDVR